MKHELTDEQKEVVVAEGNIAVIANAGSGKTTAMVAKILHDVKDRIDHRGIVAITFTQKAAAEIKERLPRMSSVHFINTINQFAIQEIINPFIADAKQLFHEKPLRPDYNCRFATRDQLDELLVRKGVIATYKDNSQNYIFELASEVLFSSSACQRYIKARYFKFFIDEYQDCDQQMHNFFTAISHDLKIPIVAVGDTKQFIYGWRGAFKNAFSDLSEKYGFNVLKLRKNFRSSAPVQNYINLLYPSLFSDLFVRCELDNNVVFINASSHVWSDALLSILDTKKTTAVLCRKNDDARACARALEAKGLPCVFIQSPPINTVAGELFWLYFELARYYLAANSSVFRFIDGIPNDKRDLISPSAIEHLLGPKTSYIESDFPNRVSSIISYFGGDFSMDDYNLLIQTIGGKQYHPVFEDHLPNCVALTIHSSKGREFDQVVLFARDYDLRKSDDIDLHYVAASRASQKILVCVENSHKDSFYNPLLILYKLANKSWSDVFSVYSHNLRD